MSDNNSHVQRKPCLTLISQRPTRISDVQRTRFSQRVPTPRSFRLSNAHPGRAGRERDAHRRSLTDTHSAASAYLTRGAPPIKTLRTDHSTHSNPPTGPNATADTTALPTQIRQQVPTRVEPNVNIQPPSAAKASKQVPTRFPSNINFPTPN